MNKLVGEVVGLTSYPLAGARGIAHEAMMLGRAGPIHNQEYLLYEQGTKQNKRIGQRQAPALTRLIADIDSQGTLYVEHDPLLMQQSGDVKPFELAVPTTARRGIVSIVEYGQPVICRDMGAEAADAFSDYLNKPVRLARRSDAWLHGEGGILPENRAVAPLHLAFTDSVDALQNAERGIVFGPDRLRSNILMSGLDGFEPFAENEWVDRILRIGRIAVPITQLTARCSVVSHDQRTGENKKDAAQQYPGLQKNERGLPCLGVYGYPVLPNGVLRLPIQQGDPVELVPYKWR